MNDTTERIIDNVYTAMRTPGTDLDELAKELYRLADHVQRTTYRARIRRIAADTPDERDSDEDFEDVLHETVDALDLVIYTHIVEQVLRVSDNADAWEVMYDGTATAEVQAYYAIMADVREAIEEMGGDPGADTVGDVYADALAKVEGVST